MTDTVLPLFQGITPQLSASGGSLQAMPREEAINHTTRHAASKPYSRMFESQGPSRSPSNGSRKIPYFGLVILRQVSKIGDMDSALSIPKTPSLTHLRFQWPNLLTIQEFPDGNDGRTIRTQQLWLIPDEHQAWHSALVPRGKKSGLTRYDIKLRRIQLHTNYLMKPRMAQYHPYSRIAAPVTLTPKKIKEA